MVTEAAEMLQITVSQPLTYEEIIDLAIKGLESLGLGLEEANALLDKSMAEE